MDSIAASYEQRNRLIQIFSPLGDNVLLLEAIDGTEEISELFEFTLTVMSKQDGLTGQDVIGQSVDFQVVGRTGESVRTWNGLVTDLHAHGYSPLGLRQYSLTIRPFLWMLTRTTDCRIVHNKTSQDITTLYLQERGFSNVRFKLLNPLKPRDYCVQYNETAFTYLSRLWEEDGLFWWFEHEMGKHTLVIADSSMAYSDAPNPTPKLLLRDAPVETGITDLHDWHERSSFISGKRTGQDWNFETPGAVVTATSQSLIKVGQNTSYELYEYPGRVLTTDTAQAATNLRMGSVEADYAVVTARSYCRDLAPGLKFTPVCFPTGPAFPAFVVQQISHTAREGSYYNSLELSTYEATLEAIPATQTATPHRDTPRPRIEGLQTAVVVGPPGEEIFTDNYGRIQVRFPWDRRGDISCWIRVVQPWGGGSWGAMVIPRVGMEVVIAFQDGDPDRPMCVGTVVNPNNMSPYELPARKTRMVFRSQTYKGTGFNELAMEDLPGAERLHMNAQHDHTIHVGNNQTERVDVNQVKSVGAHQSIEVGGNQKTEVGGSMNLVVGAVGPLAPMALAGVASLLGQTAGLLSAAGGGAVAMSVAAGALGFFEGGALTAREGVVAGPSPRADAGLALTGAGGGLAQAVGDLFGLSGVMNTVIAGHKTESVGISSTEQVGTAKVVNIGQNFFTQVGNTYKIAAGSQFIIECGASKFIMTSDGHVTILGTSFNFTSSGPVQINGQPVDLN